MASLSLLTAHSRPGWLPRWYQGDKVRGGVLNSASLRLFIGTVPIDISTARLVERRCGEPHETLLRPCKKKRKNPLMSFLSFIVDS